MQVFRQYIEVTNRFTTIELSHNKFIDDSDPIGIFIDDPKEGALEFLALENYRQEILHYYDADDDGVEEGMAVEIVLSDARRVYERSALTLIKLLGEIGGLYGAIVVIPSFFLSNFIHVMFMRAIVKLMPSYKEDSGKNNARN